MKRSLIFSLIIFLTNTSAQAQKTLGTNAWGGIVVSANESTREITLTDLRGDKKTTFTGRLEVGYQQQLKDGTFRELSMSEFKPGLRIRVFYKEKTENVSGRKVKVAIINHIDFLGRDEFTRLREILGVVPNTPITVIKDSKFPLADPLKVYTPSQEPRFEKRFRNWVKQWNEKEGKKYGQIELVDQRENSDLSIVSFWGSEDAYAPAIIYDLGGDHTYMFLTATVQFVTLDNDGLKLLWLQPVFAAIVPRSIENQMEKRMKARTKK